MLIAKEDSKEMSKTIRRQQSEIQVKDSMLKDSRIKLDCIEQQLYERNVQIVGLPESDQEADDMKKVVQLAKVKMGLNIETDIDTVHRLGKKTNHKSRDLIIKFKTKAARQEFYQNRKKTCPSKYPQENIYINDQITDYRKGLFLVGWQATQKLNFNNTVR